MNQKLWSGLTATLLVSTLGIAQSGYAEQFELTSEGPARVSAEGSPSNQVASTATSNHSQSGAMTLVENSGSAIRSSTEGMSPDQVVTSSIPSHPQPNSASARLDGQASGVKNSDTETLPYRVASAPNPTEPQSSPTAPADEVVKVGEYQSQERTGSEAVIATIQSHAMGDKQAATLYVRNIPVLTFLGSRPASVGDEEPTKTNSSSSQVKVAAAQNNTSNSSDSASASTSAAELASGKASENEAANGAADSSDPVWRATTIAARLNQLYRDNVDASTITVAWNNEHRKYVIKTGNDDLVQFDSNTILPDTTRNPETDALQATNRIRRQIGNAPPLSGVTGRPDAGTRVSLGPVQFTVSGLASWYGPGFDGSPSASGETFYQNGLTAAHRTLPFGTQVRVINKDNGRSVVVRITDRGPFGGGRVIDLSTGAARVIGLIQAGVAPVSLEVLGQTTTADSQK